MMKVINKHKTTERSIFTSSNIVLVYYLFLGIIQALWTNQNAFPPMPLRLGMMGLVFGPLFFKREIIPFVFVFFITLRQYLSTDYSYMPDIYSVGIYVVLLIVLLFYYLKSIHLSIFNQKGVLLLIINLIYWVIVDGINNGVVGSGAKFYLLALLLLFFYNDRESLEYGMIGYVLVSILLSVYYYLNYETFLNTWNTAEGIERSGWADPNYFSMHLGIGFMFCLCLIFGVIKTYYIKVHNIILALGGVMVFFAIVLTGSRAGVLSALGITFLVVLISHYSIKQKIIPIILIPIVVFIILSSDYAQLIIYRLLEEGDISTAGKRTGIWGMALDSFRQQDAFHTLMGGGWFHRLVLAKGYETHNEYVAVLCDYGILGFILLVALYSSIILNKVYRAYKFRLFPPIVYLLLMTISLSPSQYPLMPMFTSWLIMSYQLVDGKYKESYISPDKNKIEYYRGL